MEFSLWITIDKHRHMDAVLVLHNLNLRGEIWDHFLIIYRKVDPDG